MAHNHHRTLENYLDAFLTAGLRPAFRAARLTQTYREASPYYSPGPRSPTGGGPATVADKSLARSA